MISPTQKIYKYSFESDNNSGVHPLVMRALESANTGYTLSYGDDPYTESAKLCFAGHFGIEAEVFFVFTGTGANVAALSTVTRPYYGIICPETAHINVDECGAPGKFTGCTLLSVPTPDGKLTVPIIKSKMTGLGDIHCSQPKVVSITQPTELGTLYSVDEIKEICDYAHSNGMTVHMDGARIANASAALGVPMREFTVDAGVDVLSFGGTKNGMMYGEAVIFFKEGLADDFRFLHKQTTQLASKMRFVAVQFEAMFKDDLWFCNAANANNMAGYLAEKVLSFDGVKLVYPVLSNAVFVTIPDKVITMMQKEHPFYVIDSERSVVRWMTSFDTKKEDVDDFVAFLKKCLENSEN
ncbi:low specificity L-threonine aldolase [Methanoplanus sp. FWC-SCC4]|uniref:Low specificity L-threonine aldolase n=1 Tax=Methanochimaera problematica TaxID=2609417 RepID=A0AA97I322_9EURY|nr:low specificity L-threonine aldolase [Methanoplanus sp. FWC-SCC4]WOF15431.1 low specificity L-threonine aldolase [Methanoplanus sp. FWC-SCC4]